MSVMKGRAIRPAYEGIETYFTPLRANNSIIKVARSAPPMRGLKRKQNRSINIELISVARSAPPMRGLKRRSTVFETPEHGLVGRAIRPAYEGIETLTSFSAVSR